MPRLALLLTATLAALMMLVACTKGGVRPEAPACAVKPQPVLVTERVYVPVPAALTARHAVPEGPLSACPLVAAQRRAVIEAQNAQLEQVEAIQSTEAKP